MEKRPYRRMALYAPGSECDSIVRDGDAMVEDFDELVIMLKNSGKKITPEIADKVRVLAARCRKTGLYRARENKEIAQIRELCRNIGDGSAEDAARMLIQIAADYCGRKMHFMLEKVKVYAAFIVMIPMIEERL